MRIFAKAVYYCFLDNQSMYGDKNQLTTEGYVRVVYVWYENKWKIESINKTRFGRPYGQIY